MTAPTPPSGDQAAPVAETHGDDAQASVVEGISSAAPFGQWVSAADFNKTRERLLNKWGRAERERDALAARCKELERDAARLDWLELTIRDGSYQSIIHDVAAVCAYGYQHFGNGPAIRTAIDGAMPAIDRALGGEAKP